VNRKVVSILEIATNYKSWRKEMNRSERRKKHLNNSNKISKQDLDIIKAAARAQAFIELESKMKKQSQKAAGEILKQLFGLTLMTMHEQYGWGNKRLDRLFDQLVDTHKKFENHEISLGQLNQYVKGVRDD